MTYALEKLGNLLKRLQISVGQRMRGDLEITTHPKAKGIEVTVRYVGADEWYTIVGSPIESNITGACPHPSFARELYECVVRHLTTPRKIVDGNEESTSLLGFSPIVG
jgi:hypothetical protein